MCTTAYSVAPIACSIPPATAAVRQVFETSLPLIGFQGRGGTDVVQHHSGHPFLLESFLFQRPSITRYALLTMEKHKTSQPNMRVTILSCPMPVYASGYRFLR